MLWKLLRKLFRREKKQRVHHRHRAPPDRLNEPVVDIGDGDTLTVRNLREGVCVLGETGSGKSSGSGQTIVRSELAHGFSMVFLCTKVTDAADYGGWCLAADMQPEDIYTLGIDTPHRFNLLSEFVRLFEHRSLVGQAAGELFLTLGRIAGGMALSTSDSYFLLTAKELFSIAVMILLYAEEPVTFPNIAEFLYSTPTPETETKQNSPFYRESYCGRMIMQAGSRVKSDGDIADLIAATHFLTKEWAKTPDRQRSGVTGSVFMVITPFLRGALRELFSDSASTFQLADLWLADRPKALIIDTPLKTYGVASKVITAALVYLFFQAVERRDITQDGGRHVGVYADEGQYLLAATADTGAISLDTARSSGVCFTLLSQSYSAILHAVGGSEAAANTLLANLTCKIFHASSDHITTTWMANTIGKDFRTRANTSIGNSFKHDISDMSHDGKTLGASFNTALEHYVQPSSFTMLPKGSAVNDYRVGSWLFKAGKRFNASGGLPFRYVEFSQKG